MSKGLYYIVTEEHKKKIDSSLLDHQTLYEILSRLCPYKKDANGYVSIPSKTLQTIARKYTDYIEFLVYSKIIFVNNTYSVKDSICRKYKLREESPSAFVRVEMTNRRFIWERINYINLNRHNMKLISKAECFRKMNSAYSIFVSGLDFEKIHKEIMKIDEIGQRMLQAVLAYRMEDNELYFQRNKTNNRLDTNLTSFKGSYKFLHHNNFQVHVDIKNSQPFFLYILLDSIYYNSNSSIDSTPPSPLLVYNVMQNEFNSYNPQIITAAKNVDFEELKRYGELVKKGMLYEFIAEQKNLSREDVKNIIMKVLFSKNTSFKSEKANFNSLFPTIGAFISKYKSDNGYEEMAVLLQRMESFHVIDNICRIMATNGIMPVTIHDSWLVSLSQKEEAIEIIREYFGDDAPTLKIEPFEAQQKKLFPQYYS